MCKLKYLWAIFFMLQTLALNASAYCEFDHYKRKFIRDMPNGLYEVQDFYPTGEKSTEPFLVNDIKEAKKTEYTLIRCQGLDPIFSIEGKYISYYKNGLKAEEGFFKKGIRIGIWKAWYATGEKLSKTVYEDNNKEYIGDVVYWYKTGLKKSEGKEIYVPNYINYSRAVGPWKMWYWDKEGKLLYTWKEEYVKDFNNHPTGIWIKKCKGIIPVYIEKFNYIEGKPLQRELIYKSSTEELTQLGCN